MSSDLQNSINLFVQILFLTVVSYYIYQWIARKLKYKLPPGPMGLPIVGCLPLLGEKPYKALAEMRGKYGDLMGLKLGPQYTVVVHEYNLAKEVLNHPSAWNKSEIVFKGFKVGFGAANGTEWQEQRKVCMHIMRNLGLGRGPWETLIKESTRDFVEELRSFKGQPTEMEDVLDSVLSNNIISLLVGRRLNPETEEKTLQSVKEFPNVLSHFGPFVAGSIIPGFRKFCENFGLFGYDKTKNVMSIFYDFIKKELKKHRLNSDLKSVNDFINLYDEKMKQAQSQNTLHTFSDLNLLGNIAVLFIGGEDTVASSLTWLFRLMAKYPEIQNRVHAELDEVIGTDGSVTYEDRNKVPYIFAVLQEAQRVSSIVPLSPVRSADYDFEVRGYSIPKGTLITANTWAIHHDPESFPNPSEFIPERFLPKDKSNTKDIPKTMTFSLGKRNCPGETVAWMVILQFFTTVMQKFTISPPPGKALNFDVRSGIVEHLKPQPLCFQQRH